MRLLVLWVLLAFAAPAYAQQAQDATPAPQTENPEARKQLEWKGPSGFWTSPYPAKGGAYRWRMMAIGGVLLVGTGLFTWWLVKNARK
ncbi:MAG TPA: hypothetical protein VIV11_22735 [Kofleriaceae bacterium]